MEHVVLQRRTLIFCGLVLLLAFGTFRTFWHTAATSQNSALPPALQSTLARTLGKDDPRYHITDQVAQNEKQSYSATFTTSGVSFSSGFTLSVPNADYQSPTTAQNIITYDRGTYTEWYVNSPYGIEQGFTLTRPTTIEVAISGAQRITLHHNQKGLDITTPSRTLAYQGLTAFDANGRELNAFFIKKSETLLASSHGRYRWTRRGQSNPQF